MTYSSDLRSLICEVGMKYLFHGSLGKSNGIMYVLIVGVQ